MIIGTAAYLHLCKECQPHAWIVCADGSRTRDVATKKALRASAEHLLERKKVSKEEFASLHGQINAADLPEEGEGFEAQMTYGVAVRAITFAAKLSERLYADERTDIEGDLAELRMPSVEGMGSVMPNDLSRHRVLN